MNITIRYFTKSQINWLVKVGMLVISLPLLTNCVHTRDYVSRIAKSQYISVYMQPTPIITEQVCALQTQMIFDGLSRTCIATDADPFTGETDYIIGRWYKDSDTLKIVPISQMRVRGTKIILDSLLYEHLIELKRELYQDRNIDPYDNSKIPKLYPTDYVKFLIKGDKLIPIWSTLDIFRACDPKDHRFLTFKLVGGKILWSQPELKRFIENPNFEKE